MTADARSSMRLLILGVTGMIGHKVWQALTTSHDDVVGAAHRGHPADVHPIFHGRSIEYVEAADFDDVTALLNRVQPAVIINCLGITKRKAEADDIALMFQVNARLPHHLAHWAARNGCRVIQFSTDCVFDGKDGNYAETSVVTAQDLYGQTKYFGELDYGHCLTIRTSMVGRELSGRTELLEWFLAQSGKTVSGFTNAMYSGLTTNEMAMVLRRIIDCFPELSGKYQVAGPMITKYDLLCKCRDAFGIDASIVPESGFVCDRTLQCHRFGAATGIRIPSWDEMLTVVAADRSSYRGQPASS